MEKPLISIAVALYNGEKYFSEQIQSLLSQSYRNLEIIVVDDGSVDRSFETALDFSKKDSRVKVFKNDKNLGLVLNFLKAAGLCGGEYVCFSDQDDIWHKDKVCLLLDIMQRNPKNLLVYSDLEIIGKKGGSFWRAAGMRPKRGFLGLKSVLRSHSPGCAMMFDKSIARLLGQASAEPQFVGSGDRRLDEVIFMHDHLAFVLASLLGRVDFHRKKLVHYRQHENNAIGAAYQADRSREHFVEGLRKKISFLKNSRLEINSSDFLILEGFANSLESSAPFKSARYWKYYLYLRKDTAKEKIIGMLECFFPNLYNRIRRAIGRMMVKSESSSE